jgi:HlyD family secretion protein
LAASRFKLWLAGVPVILLSGMFIYFTKPDDSIPVRVVDVQQGELKSSLTTNGKVEPAEKEELRAAAAGFVRKVLVREGDRVGRGQVLMELGRTQAEASSAQAHAELDAAEADVRTMEQGGPIAEVTETEQKLKEARAARDEAQRTLVVNERLLEKNAIARVEVEQSREKVAQADREIQFYQQRPKNRFSEEDRRRAASRVTSARAALSLTDQQLGSTRVVSSQPGTVYFLPVHEGSFVNTGDVLANIGNMDLVRVRAFVDEPELGRLRPGLEAKVRWDALPGSEWNGKVERLPSAVTALGSRNVGEVVCTIENKDHRLLANVNVDVEMIVERRDSALTLPKEAVIYADHGSKGHYVFVIDGDVVRQRAVQIGTSNATRFEIVSGLKPGDKIAIPGERALADGVKIRQVT